MASDPNTTKVRLDKWLWAARFFKTRSLAHDAIEGGKVQVNGVRVKPGKTVEIGQEIQIKSPRGDFTVVVAQIGDRRVSAPLAAQMFSESEESHRAREDSLALRRLVGSVAPSEKPNTQDRRLLRRIKEGGGSE